VRRSLSLVRSRSRRRRFISTRRHVQGLTRKEKGEKERGEVLAGGFLGKHHNRAPKSTTNGQHKKERRGSKGVRFSGGSRASPGDTLPHAQCWRARLDRRPPSLCLSRGAPPPPPAGASSPPAAAPPLHRRLPLPPRPLQLGIQSHHLSQQLPNSRLPIFPHRLHLAPQDIHLLLQRQPLQALND